MKNYKFQKIDDSIRGFIESKMHEVDPTVYTDDDFDKFFDSKHENIVAYNPYGRIVAFACVQVLDNGYKMCYTYACKDGKRAYAEGIDYMLARYTPMFFGKGALKLNKIKRIIHG